MSELQRILALPRRSLDPVWLEELAAEMTKQLKTPEGTQKLRPVQALALYDIATLGGCFGAIQVGGGKSLLSLMAPTVLDSKRAVLLIPASLVVKTERDRQEYAKHWQVSRGLRLMSYEMLGRVSNAQTLDSWAPNLIVCDEQHRIKNLRAACTRRVARYMDSHPDTRFVGMSGTIVKHSIKDYAHLVGWSLKQGSPLPLKKDDIEEWAKILDDDGDFMKPKKGTILDGLGLPLQEGYRKRLSETPGVVISVGKGGCDASLLVRGAEYQVNAATEENFRVLRSTWCLPTGEALSEAVAVWRHARELALGLHYRWDPPGPEEWLMARSAWAKYVRGVLQRSRTYDSEMQVALAVKDGALQDPMGVYATWREVRETFTPNPIPVWHDDSALNAAQGWGEHAPGIIWSSHSFFGKELARRMGAPYYGQGGLSEDGTDIATEDGKRTIVASMQANGTGRNLQIFFRNLVCAAPSGADQFEQLLGRTHREGQTADEVTYDIMLGCKESLLSLKSAKAGARMIEATTGLSQKLLLCDWDVDDEEDHNRPGWRWRNQEEDT